MLRRRLPERALAAVGRCGLWARVRPAWHRMASGQNL